MGLDINLNTSKVDISEDDGINVDLYKENIDVSDDEADDIIIEITGLKSISKFIGLEDTPLYYDNGKFFKVENNKIVYTDIEWKDISGDINEAPEIVKVIGDLIDDISSKIINERISAHNESDKAHPYIQDAIQENYNTLDTKINTTKEEISGDILDLSNALTDETEDRINADNALDDKIDIEISNRSIADTTLQNNINTLSNTVTSNYNDLSNGIANLTGIVTDNYNTLDGEIEDLSTTVNNNYTSLDNRITTTEEGILDLTDTVDNNNTAINNRVDGIVDGFDADIEEINTNISNLQTTVSDNYTDLNTNIQNEATTRAENDSLLQGNINTLNNNLTNEINNRTTADSNLQTQITTNKNDITSINNTISGYGNIVSYNAEDFATSLQGQKADTAIQPNDNITLLNNNAGYITNADLPTLEDLTTQTQLDAINSGATASKIGQITTNTSNINSLSDTVTNNYNTLDGRITSEVSALNTSIGTETTNRQNADNNLQSQIDAITSASDVFDIVGTYEELQAYDISTVPVNDIIKVLVDSTHNNSATYYRCTETGNVKSWSYIGSEGAYYTKSEADGLFVEQTTTVNGKPLSNNITLTASDVGALPSSTVIGSGVLTIQVNGSDIDTFNANATSNKSINIAVPTKTSDLTNDSNFVTSSTLTTTLQDYVLGSSLATVATSGSYNDLSNKPTVDQTYDGTSTNAQSGVAIEGELDNYVPNARKVNDKPLSDDITLTASDVGATTESYVDDGLATKVSKSGDSMTGDLEISKALYLTNIANSVSSSVSKLYFGSKSSPYNYITANTGGVFGIYNSAGNGVSCYPTQNFFSTAGIDLGRANNKWKNLYVKGTLYGNSSNMAIDSIISGASAGATAVQPEDLATVATSGSYDDLSNKPTIPTVNNATLTIQKNSINIDTFTANASVDKTINISVPINASDVNALPDTTKYGSSIDVSLNTADYKLTISLKDQDGTVLNSKVVDFPIESVVVNGSYDNINQKIILTLQNGNTIDIPVGALISGLQTEITNSNKLDADLVDDSTSTNKFVTANDKTTWNNKQDTISDLSTIRSNATNGQNAYTTIQNYGNIVTHNTSEFATSAQGTLADSALQPNDNISDLNNDAGYITSSALTNYVTTDTDQNITGIKTFVGDKRVKFKGSTSSSKLGFTAFDSSNREVGYLEAQGQGNASHKCRLGVYDTNTSTYDNVLGFEYYKAKGSDGALHRYNLLCPPLYPSTTEQDFYIPMSITDGTNTLTATNTGTVDISSLLPDVSNFVTTSTLTTTLADYQPLLVSGTNIKTINNTSLLGSGNIDTQDIIGIEYDSATYQEVLSAYNNGKYMILYNSSDDLYVPFTYTDGSTFYFVSPMLISDNKVTVYSINSSGTWNYIEQEYADTVELATNYQSKLVSGTNIKTVNNTSLLGSGNINIPITTVDQTYDGTSTNAQSGVAIEGELTTNYQSKLVSGTNIKTVNSTSLLGSGDVAVQPTLVSGTNIKTINNESILGSGNIDIQTGGTVDQTYDGTSANAQSGVAIEGAGFLKNTATGTNALTILGTATNSQSAINIGVNSVADDTRTVALGYNAQASSNTSGSTVIGAGANSSSTNGIAIGSGAIVWTDNAIQIGTGTNSSGGLQVYNYQLLDKTTGLIPDTRISSNIARTSQIPSTSGLEQTSNKVTSITSSSTDTQYPSAKCVYDELSNNYVAKSEVRYDSTTQTLYIGVAE